MKAKRNLGIIGLVILLFSFSGCALFLIGAGAAGGYAISKDTIEGIFERSSDRVYHASREVAMQDGFIRLEDKLHGQIEAEIRKSKVEIEIQNASEKTVRLRVKARKGYKLLPDMGLANDVYNKISQKLR